MRKTIVIIGVLMLMFSTNSCKSGESFNDELEDTSQKCDKVIKAIENQDEDALKELFSTIMLKEAADLDKGVSYIFGQYQGTYVKKERVGFGSEDAYEKGEHSRVISAYYKVYTDKTEYIIYLKYWPENDFNKDMEGIYSLGMIPIEQENNNKYYDQEYVGVYYPEWKYKKK